MSTPGADNVMFGWGLIFAVCGVAIFGWQVYEYLRYNIWTPFSLITALEWMKIQWASYPTDWVGLYNILKKIPLSLTMILLGWFFVVTNE